MERHDPAGPGHVSLLLAELVGPAGSVVGIDRDPRMLEQAERRRVAAGADHVRYLEADVRAFRDPLPVDAVVERLVLFRLPDAIDSARDQRQARADPGARPRPGVVLSSAHGHVRIRVAVGR